MRFPETVALAQGSHRAQESAEEVQVSPQDERRAAALANGDPSDDAGQRDELARCARAAARAVQQHYESVRDLEARFEQTTKSIALGTGAAAATSRSTGRVVFAKPGRITRAASGSAAR